MKDTNTKIYIDAIPKISREYALSLKRRFPAKPVSTTMSLAEIHDKAGEQRIISIVLRDAGITESETKPTELKEDYEARIDNQSYWNRITKSLKGLYQ